MNLDDLVRRLNYCRICNDTGIFNGESCIRCGGSIAREAALAIKGLRKDGERLDYLEALAKEGGCPGLVNDDNGHWALSESGMQNVPEGEGPQDISTSFFVGKNEWHNTARDAIDTAIRGKSE